MIGPEILRNRLRETLFVLSCAPHGEQGPPFWGIGQQLISGIHNSPSSQECAPNMVIEHTISSKIRPPIKLVVVEDNASDRNLLVELAQKAGVEDHVEFFDSGEKAIEYLVPDIAPTIFAVFLEVQMQKVDGIEVLRHLRSQEATAHLPVIIMTRSRDPEHVKECGPLKVSGSLTKPIEFPEFCRAISFLLERFS